MLKRHAAQIARCLMDYAHFPDGNFKVTRLRAGRPLVGFHKWADGKPLVAADHVVWDDGTVLHLLLIDWGETGNYYLVLYPADRSNPHAELWKTHELNSETELLWAYAPRKRDGRNSGRLAYFEKHFGAREVRIALPQAADDSERFLKDLFDLVDHRIRADQLDPSKPEARAEFPEGAAVERLHKSRERNSALVALAKRMARDRDGHLRCTVCGFDFHATYGAIGDGFIEAHHIRPLSDLTSAVKSTVEDLVVVCSNCHRMLHRKRPWLGKGELHMIFERRRPSRS